MKARRSILTAICLAVALAAAGCGGIEGMEAIADDGQARPELNQLGGKADVPEWLKPQPSLLGCAQPAIDPVLPVRPLAAVGFEASLLPRHPVTSISGRFEGSDSAHLYPMIVSKDGTKVTLELTTRYISSLGTALAVYDVNGKRIAKDRHPNGSRAEVTFDADEGLYLVAAYSVAWQASGNYGLTVSCSQMPGPLPQICGGIAGIPCPPNKKCKLDGNYPDASGTCVDRDYCDSAADCKNLPMPMYCIGAHRCEANKCVFRCEWEGECDELDKLQCGVRQDCEWVVEPGHPGFSQPKASCKEKSTNPPKCYVGGCSGQLCSPIQGMVSTCEWRPHYGCYKKSECGNYGPNGACGWKKTPDFIQCMGSAGTGSF